MSANTLFDTIITDYSVKNDAALSRALGVNPPVISNMRRKRIPVGPTMILNIHETFQVPVRRIRELVAAE